MLVLNTDLKYLINDLFLSHVVIFTEFPLEGALLELSEGFRDHFYISINGSYMLLLVDNNERLVIDLPLKFVKAASLHLDIVFPHLIELARLRVLEFLHN